MKIRVEYEVPDNDCWECKDSAPSFMSLFCARFKGVKLKRGKDGKFQRCQQCIEAEVKEGGNA